MTFRPALVLVLVLAAAAPAGAGETVGWRTDWTGRYADSDPPTKWSTTENVLWKCPMPSWSNATPIIVGDRIFVCSEPTDLLCIDRGTGRILWQRTTTYFDAMTPQEAEAAHKLLETIDLKKLVRQMRQCEGQLSRTEDDLKKKPDDAALKQKKSDLQKQIDELKVQLEPVQGLIEPPLHPVVGFSTPTPVSDGSHVWAFFGTGMAACFDLEGNRQWSVLAEKPTIGYGHSASPLLVGDRLILHLDTLLALKASTGAQLWSSKASACWGTSVAAQSGGQPIIVTPNGEFFRAEDGVKIADARLQIRFSQPIVDGDTVYFVESGGKAFHLPAPSATDQKLQMIWKTTPNKERRYASPVIDQGLIYTLTEVGVFSVIDAATGQVVYEKDLEFGTKKELTYPSLAKAGDYVYASNENGTTVVIQAGREFKEVARNTLEPFRASPVFRDNRLYLRGSKNLYCIGKAAPAAP